CACFRNPPGPVRPMNRRPMPVRLLLCSLLLPATLASAQHELHPGHTSITESPTLDFAAVLQAALEHAPRALEAPARRAQAEAWQAAGDSWLAGRPALV